jgi:hypothetical protein
MARGEELITICFSPVSLFLMNLFFLLWNATPALSMTNA